MTSPAPYHDLVVKQKERHWFFPPVLGLGDAKAVHSEYFDVSAHLIHSAKIGYIRVHSLPARNA